jgi:hypothetical protein
MELLIALLAAAALVGAWFWWDRRATAHDVDAELRRICMGDIRQAERLIEGEQRRAGGTLSRADAARRAVERHRRDNR